MSRVRIIAGQLVTPLFVGWVVLLAKVVLARYLIFGAPETFGLSLVPDALLVLALLALVDFVYRGRVHAFVVLDAAISVGLVAVVMFASFYGSLPSPDALGMVGQVGTVKDSVGALLDPMMALFFADILLLGVVRLLARRPVPIRPVRAKLLLPLMAVSVVASWVLVSDAGTSMAASDLFAARDGGLLVQEAALFTRSEAAAAASTDVTDPDLVQARIEALRGTAGPAVTNPWAGRAAGRNLIVVQVESMQAFAVGLRVDGQPVTPNLDELAQDSFVSRSLIQQVGAGNTSDAEFMLDSGVYPLNTKAVAKTYGDREIPGIPRLLGEAGYRSVTFHADDIDYWNRDELYPALGYDKAYDREFFSEDDLVGIGPSDDAMFAGAAPELRSLRDSGQLFYARFMTMSSHHPFKMPASKRTLQLPSRFQETLAGDYLQSMHYVDAAIGRFIAQLKRDGLYDNSVIVVTGDHAGIGLQNLDPADRESLSLLLGRPYSPVDRLSLPLLIAVPGLASSEPITQVGGQVDIMPTVMTLMGVPLEGQVHFGRDLLRKQPSLLAVRFYMPLGTYVSDTELFVPEAGFEDGTVYRLPGAGTPGSSKLLRDRYERALELVRLSDAYLETLPVRED